jgi:hypothetical protein
LKFQLGHLAQAALVSRGVAELDALPGGKVIVDQGGANAGHLVGADGGTHAAAADSRPEIDHFVTGGAELSEQALLQAEPAVISSDSHLHTGSRDVTSAH